jgi:hypothetical protein
MNWMQPDQFSAALAAHHNDNSCTNHQQNGALLIAAAQYSRLSIEQPSSLLTVILNVK